MKRFIELGWAIFAMSKVLKKKQCALYVEDVQYLKNNDNSSIC